MKKIPICEVRYRGSRSPAKNLVLTDKILYMFPLGAMTTEEAIKKLEEKGYLGQIIITGSILQKGEENGGKSIINLEPIEEEKITRDLLKRAFYNDPTFLYLYGNFKVYYGSKELGTVRKI